MEIFGWISTIAFTLCYAPQAWKTYKIKSVADISVCMWIATGTAYLSGMVYGVWLVKWPLIANYGLGLVWTSILLFQSWYYKRRVHGNERQTN